MFLGRRATKRWHRPATIALWVLVVYLLLLWAAIRWAMPAQIASQAPTNKSAHCSS